MATDEHGAVHSEIARLLIAKKRSLGLADRDDAEIAARTGDIVLYLASRIGIAQMEGDARFLNEFGWVIRAFEKLDRGERIVGFDG